ncbi:SRPBCC family protein [Nonlabens ponticola]|uniref:Cell division protein n=1 Tax=Nonlabens ponticola TaxID=2496866 RepID=A0A3S9MX25_9FLAO|nr:SRPBCC family protein [Nonlabens ponticola]AZQ43740.1 cell division protein [Nonlabens ponticola]
MPSIHLRTEIKAPIELVFDLARSIDLHEHSMEHTNEKAIAGRTSGLVQQGETVTWQAKHLGITQKLTSKIIAVQPHHYFADEMKSGAFKRFKHEHFFETSSNGCIMRDIFDYDSPLGILGSLVDAIFLKKYMTDLLKRRNQLLKEFAESDRWKNLPGMRENY